MWRSGVPNQDRAPRCFLSQAFEKNRNLFFCALVSAVGNASFSAWVRARRLCYKPFVLPSVATVGISESSCAHNQFSKVTDLTVWGFAPRPVSLFRCLEAFVDKAKNDMTVSRHGSCVRKEGSGVLNRHATNWSAQTDGSGGSDFRVRNPGLMS
ncbi:hypothetical protein HDK90DRAFT_193335 [Phyllosticta capitalensis]|uniref:Uncharacterized protein n=1 Tax=Phyllosticta capitalensis TaxID=121624 RepID=A0ABR1YY66_9PEZI